MTSASQASALSTWYPTLLSISSTAAMSKGLEVAMVRMPLSSLTGMIR